LKHSLFSFPWCRETEKGLHNQQKLQGTFLKCRDCKKISHRMMETNPGPFHVAWKFVG
jgi:hypothetical protein